MDRQTLWYIILGLSSISGGSLFHLIAATFAEHLTALRTTVCLLIFLATTLLSVTAAASMVQPGIKDAQLLSRQSSRLMIQAIKAEKTFSNTAQTDNQGRRVRQFTTDINILVQIDNSIANIQASGVVRIKDIRIASDKRVVIITLQGKKNNHRIRIQADVTLHGDLGLQCSELIPYQKAACPAAGKKIRSLF